MADESLNFNITSNTSDLEAALSRIIQGLTQTGAQAKTMSDDAKGGFDKVKNSVQDVVKPVDDLHKKTQGLAGIIEDLGSKSRTLEIGFSALGSGAAEAAAKVEGLADAFMTMKDAIGPLLLVAAAMAGVVAAFDTLKEGVADAGKISGSLSQIAGNLHLTGDAADATKDRVKEFADQLGSSTGASAQQTISAIQRMTAAHIPLNTAMQLTKDANLEAIASGRDAGEIEDALAMAIQGRTRALVQMGIITQQEAKHGIDLDTVNRRILDSTSQAVAQYQNSLPGALAIAGENFRQLTADLTSGLVPALIDIVHGINDGIEAFHNFANAVGPVVSGALNGLKAGLAGVGFLFTPLIQDAEQFGLHVRATLGSVIIAWQTFYRDNKAIVDEVISAAGSVVDFFRNEFVQGIVYSLKAVLDTFTAAMDGIKAVADLAIGILTGHWQKFHGDLLVLTNDGMQVVNDAFGGHLAQMVAAAETAIDQIKAGFASLRTAFDDATKLNFLGASQALSALKLDPTQIGNEYKDHLKSTQDAMLSLQKQAEATTKAAADVFKFPGGASGAAGVPGNLQIQDKELGGPQGGADKSTYDPEILARATDATKAYTDAQAALEARLHSLDASLDADRAAVAGATTVTEENAAKNQLAADQAAVYAQKAAALAGALNAFKFDEAQLTVEHNAQSIAVTNAMNAYNRYAESIKGHTETKEETQRLKDLKTQQDAINKTYEDTGKQLTKVTELVQKDTEAQEANNKAKAEAKNATAEFLRSLDEDREKRQQNLQDLIATDGKSLNEQIAYYTAAMNQLSVYDVNQRERYKELYDALLTAESDGYKKLLDASNEANKKLLEAQKTLDESLDEERKKELKQAQDDVSGFLDDILTKHESFGSALKNIMAQIQKQYVASFSQMLTNSPAFSNLFGIDPRQTPTPQQGVTQAAQAAITADDNLTNATTTLTSANSTLNTTTGTLNTSTGTLNTTMGTLNSSTGTLTTAINDLATKLSSSSSGEGFNTSNPMGGVGFGGLNAFTLNDAGPNFLAKTTGSTLGVSPNSVTADSNTETTDEFGDTASDDADLFNAYKSASPTSNNTGAYLSGSTSILSGLMGGGFGDVLGGAGSIVGTALGGPVGGAIGGTLGSIIGSLFGPHPTAAKDPDEFESSTGYGQDIADIENGPAAASGVNYSPSSAVAAFAKAMGVSAGTINGFPNMGQQSINSNGTTLSSGGIDAAEIWLSQNKNDTAAQLAAMNMTPAELSSDIALLGASSTGSGLITRYDKNIGDMMITGAGSGGNEKSTYSAMEAALNQIMSAYGAAGGSSGVYSLTHSLPSFEKTTMQQIGTFSNGVYTGSSTGTGLQSGSGSTTRISGPVIGGGGLTSGSSGNMHTLNVTIENHGIVVGQNGMSQLADQVSKALAKNYSVNYGNTSGRSF